MLNLFYRNIRANIRPSMDTANVYIEENVNYLGMRICFTARSQNRSEEEYYIAVYQTLYENIR
jgi:hypothetical protein